MTRRGALLIVLTLATATAAGAQTDGGKARPGDTAVTLDQLSTASTRSRGADLDVAQPPRPSRATSVISTEISDRAAGRAVATAPIAGDDRCDAPSEHDRSDLCRKRIEARASQYTRPAPAAVTPEGRLLLLIKPADPGNRQAATVSGINDPNGPADQIASALRDRAAQDASQAKPPDAGALPPGVPTTIVLPQK